MRILDIGGLRSCARLSAALFLLIGLSASARAEFLDDDFDDAEPARSAPRAAARPAPRAPRSVAREAAPPRASFSIRINEPKAREAKKFATERPRAPEKERRSVANLRAPSADADNRAPTANAAIRAPAASVAYRVPAANAALAKLPKPVFCYPASAQPESAASADVPLQDRTLRSGDSLVTADGVLVFKGQAACPHRANDFVALADSDLPKAKRDALLALERTLHDPRFKQDSAAASEPAAVKVADQASP